MNPNFDNRAANEKEANESPELVVIGEIEDHVSLYGEKRGAIPTKHLRSVVHEELGKALRVHLPPLMAEMKNEMREAVRDEFLKMKNVSMNEELENETEGSQKMIGCKTCGKNHPGKCKYKQKGCFNCGEMGHNIKDCLALGAFCYECAQYGHESSDCPN